MNRNEIQASLLSILATIAPEMDPGAMDPEVDLRDQLDIDSMDLLTSSPPSTSNGRQHPEADYPN